MPSNSDNLAPISVTQPSTVGKGRVDLVKSDFDAAIVQKGYEVYLDKAVWCPCRRKADGQPLSSCQNCGGSGYVYINRYKTRMIVQAMNTSTKFKEWSEELIGSVRITARDEENLSFMDRITMIGAEVISNQVIFPVVLDNQLVRGKVVYGIKSINEIFAFVDDGQKLKKLEENTDYTFEDNVITFANGYASWDDFTVSVRYSHEPTYHVIDMVREQMTTKIKTGGQEKSVVMPINAIGRKSHYVLDEQDYSGTYILDNSYDHNGCGDAKDIVIDPPIDLRASSESIGSISLSWDENSDSESSFVLERSELGGNFIQLAILPPNTESYIDNSVSQSKVYFYRVAMREGTGQSVWSNVTGIFVPSGSSTAPVLLNSILQGDVDVSGGIDVNVLNSSGTFDPENFLISGSSIQIGVGDSTVSNSNNSFSQNVEAQGSLALPDVTVNATNSNGVELATADIPSVQDHTLNIADVDVSVNTTVEGQVPVGDIDINVADSSGAVTPDSVSIVGNTVDINVPDPVIPTPIGAQVPKTGSTVSHATNSDGDLQRGREVDWLTLPGNNPFGSTDRFTDELGGQTYANDIVIDWSTYNGSNKVLGYYRIPLTSATWATSVANCASLTVGTFTSGWAMTNWDEFENIHSKGTSLVSGRFDALAYAPFNIVLGNYLWTSTDRDASFAIAYLLNPFGNFAVVLQNKANSYQAISAREFTVSGTTLT